MDNNTSLRGALATKQSISDECGLLCYLPSVGEPFGVRSARNDVSIAIFDEMSIISPEEIQRLLPLVSDQRREEALKYKHLFGQFACLKSYVMLRELLESIETRDARLRDTGLTHPFQFDYNEHGKPFLADHPNIHFNISHCKNGIAVAVADQPIGIDIESYRKASESLLRYTMSEEERRIINESDDPIRTFTEYWTKKEAVFKLRGTGITHDLHGLLQGDEMVETFVNPEKQYAYSVAIKKG